MLIKVTSKMSILIFCIGLLLAPSSGLRIGSFNIQIFGTAKAANAEVMKTLTKIIQLYDIVLIQEIRDSSDTALDILIKAVNDEAGKNIYTYTVSKRLGRSSSKEQYAFVYRTDTGLNLLDTYQYSDPNDVFQREPYAAKFGSCATEVKEFVLVGIHTDPDTAVPEINALKTVHSELSRHWKTDNILIMGDFNADCTYVSKKELSQLDMRTDTTFQWLIPDDFDTTTKSTDCAYDRFVMTGSKFKKSVVSDSVKVFRFDTKYKLTQAQTEAVSDHFPIELDLKTTKCSSKEL